MYRSYEPKLSLSFRASVPLKQTISSVIGWAKDKNLDLLSSVIRHDADYVSVSPGKQVVKGFPWTQNDPHLLLNLL